MYKRKYDLEMINGLLPFLLRTENIARFEDGAVYIGDRRKYPFEKEFVRCDSVEQVTAAIKGMVTQGGGLWQAAACGLIMQARQAEREPAAKQKDILKQATEQIKGTRPTSIHLHRLVELALKAGKDALDAGENAEQAISDWLEEKRDAMLVVAAKMGRLGADLIDDGDGILTMCFAESAFILGLIFAKQDGKQNTVYVPETRPYLQGARLTAPSIAESGIAVKLITDNMPGYVVSEGKVQKYFTAADLVTLDGHVVNMVGTFQNALACHFYGVPFFVYAVAPDRQYPDRSSVKIEIRDQAEIKLVDEIPSTLDNLDAYYPAFDITPPNLVAGLITRYGILSPYDLIRYFEE
jgi:methylthioribose-1-phosphate isomerase